ncbi:MAG: hypothetical protein Q8942_10180 [Bacillota bacterium]|nr:hypothetical protein [Bacillota bacterium]
MGKKRVTRLIAFTIITVLFLLLIPDTLNFVDDLQNHTQSSKAFLTSGIFHTDVLYIDREKQKTAIQKLHVKNNNFYTSQTSIHAISKTNFQHEYFILDYRDRIRQSIPDYFNGGKYKRNHFYI